MVDLELPTQAIQGGGKGIVDIDLDTVVANLQDLSIDLGFFAVTTEVL